MMVASFSKLSDADLRELTNALKVRRVSAPYTLLQVNYILSPSVATEVISSLQTLATFGFNEEQIVTMLELLICDRLERQSRPLPVELVTSGPEAPGIANRDTAVVVRELFAH